MAEESSSSDSPLPLERAEASASRAAGPQSYADLWKATHRPPKSHARLLWAGAGALTIVLLAYPISYSLERLGDTLSVALPPLQGPTVARENDREEWLKDVLVAQKVHSSWEPLAQQAPTRPKSEPGRATTRKKSTRRHRPAQVVADEDEADPLFASLFGSKQRYATASVRSSFSKSDKQEGTGPSGQINIKGVTVAARLRDRVANSPTGAPIIALVSRRTRLGRYQIPAGSEIHGTVVGSGNEDTRIFLDFSFLRLRNGQHIGLCGTARDEAGRHGIPGKKLFSSNSVGSIGVSAATRALGAAGRALAGTAGNIFGAGIDGAAESGTRKAQRVDRDDYVIIADPGAPLMIYLTSLESDA